jgi:dolichyl-phosphate beta-glucosyltransferase
LRRPLLLVLLAALAGAVAVLGGRRRARATAVRAAQRRRIDRPAPEGELRFSVVLPAYQEANRVGDSIRRVRQELATEAGSEELEIVVVDDGSTDGTAAVAREAGADRVVVHPQNRGKGAAVRTGVLAARGRFVAFTDADLAYAPDHLLDVLQELERGWDVVVGSRRHPDARTIVRARFLREAGGRAINLLTRIVLLGRYGDTQSGLKGFRADAGRRIFSHTRVDGFAFDIEVFHLVERYGLSLTEVPVRVVHSARSSVHVVRDGTHLLGDLFRIRRLASAGAYDRTVPSR